MESINKKYDVNTKLTPEMISAKHQPYHQKIGAVQTPPTDTVEIKNKEDKTKYKKWGKIALGIGAAALAVAGVVMGKKTLDAKKAKKLEQEARKIQEEALKKAREAEEKAKSEAKLKAEQEAKIKAQKEAEEKLKAEQEKNKNLTTETKKEADTEIDISAKPIEKTEIIPEDMSDLYPISDKGAIDSLKAQLQADSVRTVEEKVVVNGISETMQRFEGTQSGSTPGSWATSADGVLYYLKHGNSAQNTTEYAAAQIYKAAGIPTPEVELITQSGTNKKWVRSKAIADLKGIRQKPECAYEGFATDVWLANWDAIISGNTVIKNGRAVRIDFGGTFNFRAQGRPKNFGEIPTELHTLLDTDINYAGYVLKDMKREDLIKSLEHVQTVKDSDINAIQETCKEYMSPELFSTLKKRKEYLGEILETAKETSMGENQTILDYVKVLEEKVASKPKKVSPKIAEVRLSAEHLALQKKTFREFGTTAKFDSTIKSIGVKTPYMDGLPSDGIPLKYSRDNFLTDLKKEFDSLPAEEQRNIAQKFNLQFNPTGTNKAGFELQNIPVIPKEISGETEQKFADIIQKFTQENEALIENPEIKELFDSILQTVPEFTAVVGKKQHNIHNYTVDIHTLLNLKSSLSEARFKRLDTESQLVLKYSTLLHDLGKAFINDFKSDTGHAERSVAIAKPILERLNLSKKVKERILKQIEHHHWFKDYNKEQLSPEQVIKIFGTEKDLTIAEIMAKSDLKNVNQHFHYDCLGIDSKNYNVTYNEAIEECFAPIGRVLSKQSAESKGILADRHGIIPITSDEEYFATLDRLEHLRLRTIYTNGKICDEEFQRAHLLNDYNGKAVETVPEKMRAVCAYTGVSGDGNGHFRDYELYRDLNRYLQKKQDIYMPKVQDKVVLFNPESEAILENCLVNVNSEEAKDLIRCVDYSLKEIDKEFGKFEGIVYRNGRFSADGGQYWSTSKQHDLHMFDDTHEYHVIKTKNGHKISDFEEKYHDIHDCEDEILLSRDSKYREITGKQYQEERIKLAKERYEYYKKYDENYCIAAGKPPKYNLSFEDILKRTHVWEEI